MIDEYPLIANVRGHEKRALFCAIDTKRLFSEISRPRCLNRSCDAKMVFEHDNMQQIKDLLKSNDLIFREVIIFWIKDWIFARFAGGKCSFYQVNHLQKAQIQQDQESSVRRVPERINVQHVF